MVHDVQHPLEKYGNETSGNKISSEPNQSVKISSKSLKSPRLTRLYFLAQVRGHTADSGPIGGLLRKALGPPTGPVQPGVAQLGQRGGDTTRLTRETSDFLPDQTR